MKAGLRTYATVLADPAARGFSLAGLVARLPMAMTGIGIVLLVSLSTGSFAVAGVVTATVTLAGAVSAPLWGRTIDRLGQAPVLVVAAAIWTVSLAVLVVAVEAGWSLPAVLAAAVGVGLGFSSAGSAVRARWSHRLQGSPLLDTAFAVEAVLDEVIFIVGPVLVTFLATTVDPALALGVAGVVGLAGALVLAGQRGTEPPRRPRRSTDAPAAGIHLAALAPVVVASVALGAVFGGMEVVVVAFATEAGVLPFAGAILMAWAAGSLVSGVLTGTVAWRRSPAARFRVGSAALALSLVPLPFVHQPLLVAALLVLSGMAIAPTLIASVAVTQAAVPQARLTEALGWTSTGLAGGLALGAAGLGALIDAGGAQLGFWGVVAAGVLLALAALGVRTRATVPAPGPVEQAELAGAAAHPTAPTAR
ncbi:Predicted arabinose efflux permease, MFS family [Friedmanniella luteola]|uniref:Predicted arabinose efflux permease, MFS family n=1 Tax=Friedmanniella luteola TaxID=546871 RepID=A0A1H1S0L7_9ACTN|nr:MFS transporter [Friedmanniella luteola]SDS41560.1 Predicted arabinose efflux permease, MFS family [Friedmanniella luteola]